MLTEELKQRIQTAYRNWLSGKGFRPRRGQRMMIAEVARRLCATDETPVAVIEAGYGNGKTVAYALAAIPVAQELDNTLVKAPATAALIVQNVMLDWSDVSHKQ